MESRRKQEAMHRWRGMVIESKLPRSEPSAGSGMLVNRAMIASLSQVALTLEERLEARKEGFLNLRRSEALAALSVALISAVDRVRHLAWNEVADYAAGGMRNQRDIRDMVNMLEQEKAVLDEEFNQALTLNEEL
jgi:hypothetical protein